MGRVREDPLEGFGSDARLSDERLRRNAQAALTELTATLAAAYAECGRYPEAISTGLWAEELALSQGQVELAVTIRDQLKLYFNHKPYRTTPAD